MAIGVEADFDEHYHGMANGNSYSWNINGFHILSNKKAELKNSTRVFATVPQVFETIMN